MISDPVKIVKIYIEDIYSDLFRSVLRRGGKLGMKWKPNNPDIFLRAVPSRLALVWSLGQVNETKWGARVVRIKVARLGMGKRFSLRDGISGTGSRDKSKNKSKIQRKFFHSSKMMAVFPNFSRIRLVFAVNENQHFLWTMIFRNRKSYRNKSKNDSKKIFHSSKMMAVQSFFLNFNRF